MGFWTVYFAVFAALVTLEVAHIGLSYWFTYRQTQRAKEIREAASKLYEASKALGTDPGEFAQRLTELAGGQSYTLPVQFLKTVETPGSVTTPPTASGNAEKAEHDGQGQYL